MDACPATFSDFEPNEGAYQSRVSGGGGCGSHTISYTQEGMCVYSIQTAQLPICLNSFDSARIILKELCYMNE